MTWIHGPINDLLEEPSHSERAREGQSRDKVEPSTHTRQPRLAAASSLVARNRVNLPSGACHPLVASPVPSQHVTSRLENEERCWFLLTPCSQSSIIIGLISRTNIVSLCIFSPKNYGKSSFSLNPLLKEILLGYLERVSLPHPWLVVSSVNI